MKIITRDSKKLRSHKIIDKYTVGIILTGNEIKSLRNYQSSIAEAYIGIHDQELFIIGMHINSYKYSHAQTLLENCNPKKKRKLLLHRQEINKLTHQLKTKNYTLIPLTFFITERGWAKLEIALAQPLRKYQIKEQVKEKEIKRKINKGDYC